MFLGHFLGLLEGIHTEIHNLKVELKEPRQLKLKEKYQKEHNNENLFSLFTEDNRDICIYSKNYHLMEIGNGLFLSHLRKSYQKKGKQVKFISFSRNHKLAGFLNETTTNITVRHNENPEKLVQDFIEKNHNVLSVDLSSRLEHKSCLSLISSILQQIGSQRDENTIYLVCSLFLDEKEEKMLTQFSWQKCFRFCYFQSNDVNRIKKKQENELSILIPRYEDKHIYKEEDLKNVKKLFPDIPAWVFKKPYYPYTHFIYQYDQQTGFYFMEKQAN
jgi:hypothetical protein